MLGKLKTIFGPGQSNPSRAKRRRVNLQRRFAIVSETSRGSMSRVYRAVDNQTGRTVCLKVQSKEKNAAAATRTSTQEPRPLEGEIAMQLAHPHIVRSYEFGDSTQGEHFLVMEYIDGVSLQYIREARSTRTAQKVELLAQAADGLAAVHAAGFMHHGTLQYMAPELLRREPIDERIDVFAFGVLAFELLTDRLPYDANNSTTMMLQRINTEPLDPAIVKPQLSEDLCNLLRQLTARRKEQRWPSMSTLPAALRGIPVKRQKV
jgi:serine/threonine protein kinase